MGRLIGTWAAPNTEGHLVVSSRGKDMLLFYFPPRRHCLCERDWRVSSPHFDSLPGRVGWPFSSAPPAFHGGMGADAQHYSRTCCMGQPWSPKSQKFAASRFPRIKLTANTLHHLFCSRTPHGLFSPGRASICLAGSFAFLHPPLLRPRAGVPITGSPATDLPVPY